VNRVLIVDDELMNRDVLKKVLGKEGFAVAEASNGEEAMALLDEVSCGLVLMDLMMPVMDGFETIAAIRRQERYRELPLVVITALNDPASLERAIALGADACIVKPFDLPLLVQTVRDALGGARA